VGVDFRYKTTTTHTSAAQGRAKQKAKRRREAHHCLVEIICDSETPTGQASTSITLAQVQDKSTLGKNSQNSYKKSLLWYR